jgi:tetratricopeptide (TPR) repeat protein
MKKSENFSSALLSFHRKAGKPLGFALFILTLASVLVMSLFPMHDQDIWYHLKSGEVILKTRSIPLHDLFSSTAQGQPWENQEWLFSALIYAIYSFSGFVGLALFKSLVLVTAAFFFYRSVRLVSRSDILASLLVAWAFLLGLSRFVERPHVVSYLFISLFIYLLLLFTRRRKNLLWLLPVIEAFWTNIHGSFIVGWAIAGYFAFESFLAWMVRKDPAAKRRTFALAGLFLAVVAVCAVNPLFMNIYLYPFEHFRQVNHETVARFVAEWFPPFHPYFRGTSEISFYIAWLSVSLLSFVLAFRRSGIARTLFYGVFVLLSLTAVRHVEVAVFATIFALALNLKAAGINFRRFAGRFPTRKTVDRAWAVAGGTLLAVYPLLLLAFTFGLLLTGAVLRDSPEAFVKVSLFAKEKPPEPVKAADYMLANPLPGNVYNTYNLGSYLLFRLYPQKKVYIDSRANIVYTGAQMEAYRNTLEDRESFVRAIGNFGVNTVVMNYPTSPEDPEINVHRYLASSKDWSLVFFDDSALIYFRRIPESEIYVNRDGYRLINPALFTPGGAHTPEDLSNRAAEYRRAVVRDPECAVAYNQLGYCEYRLGQRSEALEDLEKSCGLAPGNADYLYNAGLIDYQMSRWAESVRMFEKAASVNPRSPEYRNALGVAEIAMTNDSRAIRAFRKALALDPKYFKALVNLALLYDRTGFSAEAVKFYRKALAVNPGLAAVHDDLGKLYARLGETDFAAEQFRRSIEVDPANPEPQRDLYSLLAGRGVFAAFEKNTPGAFSEGFGDFLVSNMLYFPAAEQYAGAGKAGNANPRIRSKLGDVYCRLGRLNEAAREYEEVVSTDPADLETSGRLARIYAQLGRSGNATRLWKSMLARDSKNAEALKNLAKN